MATTLTGLADIFPVGTSVGAYPAAQRHSDRAPTGSAAESQSVASGGTLTYSSLSSYTEYVAYALVAGQHRYVDFTTGAPTGTPDLGDPGTNWATDREVEDAIYNLSQTLAGQIGIDVTKASPPHAAGVATWQANIDAAPDGSTLLVPTGDHALASSINITSRTDLKLVFLPGASVTSSATDQAFLLTDSPDIKVHDAKVNMAAAGSAWVTVRSPRCKWFDPAANPTYNTAGYHFKFTDNSDHCKVWRIFSLHGTSTRKGWTHVFADGTSDYCKVFGGYVEGGRANGIDLRGNKCGAEHVDAYNTGAHGFLSWPQTGSASTANGHHKFVGCNSDYNVLTGFFASGEGTPLNTGVNWGNHGSQWIGCSATFNGTEGMSWELGVYDAQATNFVALDNIRDGLAMTRSIYRPKVTGGAYGRNGRKGINLAYFTGEPVVDADLNGPHIFENVSDGLFMDTVTRAFVGGGTRIHDNGGWGSILSGAGTVTLGERYVYSNTAGGENLSAGTVTYLSTRREEKSISVSAPAVAVYPGFFVSLASGEIVKLVKVRVRTDTGTATVDVRKNGTAATGFGSISVTSTASSTTPTAVTLAEDDEIDLNVSAVAGAPNRLTVTAVLERSR